MKSNILANRPGVTHHVRDLRKVAEWYRDVLGLSIGPADFETFVEMKHEGQYMFHLTKSKRQQPLEEPVFGLNSSDIEATRTVLLEHGAEVSSIVWFPDYASFVFRDIEGNAVSVSQLFEMRVVEFGELHLVGIRVLCDSAEQYAMRIPEAALQLKNRLQEIDGVIRPGRMVGAYVAEDTPAEKQGYWVCLQVERLHDIPEGMSSITIPPQHYALKYHYGTRQQVGGTYRKLHQLMKEAGLTRLTAAWHLEMTRHWGKPAEGEIEIDLYEPMQ
jgi:predicted transcriptional regulator YdeE